MTPLRRMRLEAPVLFVYWLMLVGGLTMYTALRVEDAAALVPLWAGAIVGTAVGQLLALVDVRAWIALVIVGFVGYWLVPAVSEGVHVVPWVAVVPAAVCGYWSLGDRGVLFAWWFPTMLWMLSILETIRVHASERTELALGGGLAVAFMLFLRVRESRRVAMWRTIAPTPLAVTKSATTLREVPGRQLARGGWSLVIGGLALAITAWLAPRLWQTETQTTVAAIPRTDPVMMSAPWSASTWRRPYEDQAGIHYGPSLPGPSPTVAAIQRPCCPVEDRVRVKHTRVKEYLDIGRGQREDEELPPQHVGCRVCTVQDEVARINRPQLRGGEGGYDDGIYAGRGPWYGDPATMSPDDIGRWMDNRIKQLHAHDWPVAPSPIPSPAEPTQVAPWLPAQQDPSHGPAEVGPSAPRVPSQIAPHPRQEPSVPSQIAPSYPTPYTPPVPSRTPSAPSQIAPPVPPRIAPPPHIASAPPPHVASAPSEPAPAKAAAVAPKVAAAKAIETPKPPTPEPAPKPVAPTPPAPVAPKPIPSAPAVAAAVPTAAPAAMAPKPAAAADGPGVLHWLALIALAGLIFQTLVLALRPLRRLVTLRHLRRPFWDETVDQRVSNSWQLALVGLRDAGWRAADSEAPREFAQRVGIGELEQCATILERARHGIGIDATDLSDMATAAEATYRAARKKLGPLARATATVRWPLA